MVDNQRWLFKRTEKKKLQKTLVCLCCLLVIALGVRRRREFAVASSLDTCLSTKALGSPPPSTFRFTFCLSVPCLLIIQFSRDPIFLRVNHPSLFEKLVKLPVLSKNTLSYDRFLSWNFSIIVSNIVFPFQNVAVRVSTHSNSLKLFIEVE